MNTNTWQTHSSDDTHVHSRAAPTVVSHSVDPLAAEPRGEFWRAFG